MKASDDIIKKRKESFAETYRGKAPEKLAIIAASQHGRLYSPNADPKKKLEFRAFWENQLKELGKKYKDTPQTEEQFIKDIEIYRIIFLNIMFILTIKQIKLNVFSEHIIL